MSQDKFLAYEIVCFVSISLHRPWFVADAVFQKQL
jgi:hypothetical protein